MYTEKGSFGISISHLWTDYWIDFVAWPMISFCSDEPGVTAHICIRSYKTGRSLPHIYIYNAIRVTKSLQISRLAILKTCRMRRNWCNSGLCKKSSVRNPFFEHPRS